MSCATFGIFAHIELFVVFWNSRHWPSCVLSIGFPYSLAGKEFTCNVGGLSLIPGLGRSPGARKGATHSSTLAWRIPQGWNLQSMGLQRFRCDWVTFTFTFHFSVDISLTIFFKKRKKENYIVKYHSFVIIKVTKKSWKHYTLHQDHDLASGWWLA